VLLQFAPAVGTRQYDWNRKQVSCYGFLVISTLMLYFKTKKALLGFQLVGFLLKHRLKWKKKEGYFCKMEFIHT